MSRCYWPPLSRAHEISCTETVGTPELVALSHISVSAGKSTNEGVLTGKIVNRRLIC